MDFKVDLKQLRSSHVGTFVLTSIDTLNSNKWVYLSFKPHRDTLVNEFGVFFRWLEPILIRKWNRIYWNNMFFVEFLFIYFSPIKLRKNVTKNESQNQDKHAAPPNSIQPQFLQYMTALKSQFYDSSLLFKY